MANTKRKRHGYWCHGFDKKPGQKHKFMIGLPSDKTNYVCSNCGKGVNTLKGYSNKS